MIAEIIQSLTIIFFEALCCVYFLNIFLRKKNYSNKWVMKSLPLFLTAGFFVVALFAPNFLLKSILIIMVIVAAVKMYYDATILQNIVLSLIFYGILIGLDYILLVLLKSMLSDEYAVILNDSVSETIIALLCKLLLLLIVVLIGNVWKGENNLNVVSNKEWLYISCFPVISIISMAGMLSDYPLESKKISNIFLLIAFGMVSMSFLVFYLLHDIVKTETALQDTRLIQERTKNQMNLYRNMQDTYERQRRKSHDYKNQMICIQGMLANGKTEEAIEYITNLTGNLIKDMDVVNTNNTVVDAILNQKYRYAQANGITLVMMVNDLTDLAINEEDIVIVLSNILDNALDACNKFTEEKVIKLKITMEKGQLLISAQNPIIDAVKIVDNRIMTTKADRKEHGIGLLNIAQIIEKYDGTYAIQCKNGWFHIAVQIPC